MRIKVKSKGTPTIRIAVPTFLLTGRAGTAMIAKALAESVGSTALTPAELKNLQALLRGISRWRREHGPIDMVDIVSADGDEVNIRI